jgi:hypothetical protein
MAKDKLVMNGRDDHGRPIWIWVDEDVQEIKEIEQELKEKPKKRKVTKKRATKKKGKK